MLLFDRIYRQRLEMEVTRWQADGIITPAIGEAIRSTLPPFNGGINIPVIVAIAGGLLIAAAFLAFVASNWTEIPRVLRFAMLLTGIAGAHGAGAGFARTGRPILADLCVSVGAIIFGAAIALVGQMYHLGDDFAAGMLVWAVGALAAAALTGSRGALAVALVAGALWNGSRVIDGVNPHYPFVLLWLISAGLPLAWKSQVAAHLVTVAGLAWWVTAGFLAPSGHLVFAVADGAALLLGAGLLVGRTPALQSFGATLSTYGAFALAVLAIFDAVVSQESVTDARPPAWAVGCGLAGLALAVASAAFATDASRRAGSIFAGIAIAFVIAINNRWIPLADNEAGGPWLAYALELAAMLCLTVSGMLDGARPRMVAGWIGLAGGIAAITWAVKGSLLRRSLFLGVSGAAAVALAALLGRWLPKEDQP